MKFSLLAIAFFSVLSLFPATAHAQTWQRLAPDLFDVQWVGSNMIVACGSYGLVMRSDDAGETWRMQPTGAYQTLWDLHFFDVQNGVVVGDSGKVFTTSDGGETWQQSAFPTTANILSVVFREDGFGLASTLDSLLLQSMDYGRTWSVLQNNLAHRIGKVVFMDDSTLCALTYLRPGLIYRSEDAGKTWGVVFTDSTHSLRDIDFKNGVGIVAGGGVRPNAEGDDRSLILRTTDMGQTWERRELEGVNFELHSVEISSEGDRIITAGRRSTTTSEAPSNRAVVSTDSGITWESYEMNALASILSIFGVAIGSMNNAVAVGSMGGIYLTSDSGQTWRTRSFCRVHDLANNSQFQTVVWGSWYFDPTTIIAYGEGRLIANGVSVGTRDLGVTWNSETILDPITGAVFFSSGQGIGLPRVGTRIDARGKFYSIEDNGTAWVRQAREFDKEYSYEHIYGPVHGGDNLYFTGDSLIFRSTDAGQSWSQVSVVPNVILFNDLNVFSNRWIVTATDVPMFIDDTTISVNYRILRSEDQGESWETLISTTSFDSSASMVAFYNADLGFYGTRGGMLYQTTNGGDSWDRIERFDGVLAALEFFTDSLFYLVGNNGLIAHSTDAGNSWTAEYVLPRDPNTPGFSSIRLSPDRMSAILTGPGLLMRGDFPEPVTSAPEELEVSEVGLHLSVHPNPVVGDEVRLRVEGLGRGGVELELYDVTGRLLESQKIMGQGGGTDASYRLSVAGVVPGVYRVVVRQGGREANLPVTIVR